MTDQRSLLPGLVSDADHLSLSRLVGESAWRVDSGQASTVYELFTEDGVLDIGKPCRGSDAIRTWGQELERNNPYPGIRHLASNMRFVATGVDTDGRDTAEGVTVLTVYVNDAGGRPISIPWGVGEDHDQFVRTNAGWRFTHRTWVQLFSRDPA